jgi:hypothetical protein
VTDAIVSVAATSATKTIRSLKAMNSVIAAT